MAWFILIAHVRRKFERRSEVSPGLLPELRAARWPRQAMADAQ